MENQLETANGLRRLIRSLESQLYTALSTQIKDYKSMDNQLEKANGLRRLIRSLESQLYRAKTDLRSIEYYCQHLFGDPVRFCDRICGDECNVRWVRTCERCGVKERNKSVREEKAEIPVF